MGLEGSLKERELEKEKYINNDATADFVDVEKGPLNSSYKSDWARDIERRLSTDADKIGAATTLSYKDAIKKPAAAGKDIYNENVKKKPLKMDNSLETEGLHTKQDWGWNDSNEDWQGTIEREKEKERKKLLRRGRLMNIQIETATKANKIVGAHPITQTSINKFNVITGDYEEAKREAAREYLINILGFEMGELEMFMITDTQVSGKGDNVLYIGEIRKRVAERQHPDIFIRDFIPPQFFSALPCTQQTVC